MKVSENKAFLFSFLEKKFKKLCFHDPKGLKYS